ncbi:hypothetical protein [Aurantiacibacter poecillastricola]|uniref:hypothetical protein n=1 Tax=Aurantiacibacter poecillastricola TaxID=3064385 RepID=UPI00273F6169|nr:hypothetical protein [Aurantiacibacter sp. 219JJ12-13]MDP5260449.1 hypothetical protein [Aurantiacibacter sp. 219JJ12-13]
MATSKSARTKRRFPWLTLLVVVAAAIGGAAWYYNEMIGGYTRSGTAYAAKYVCSCRYLGGREVRQCREDLLPGMGVIWLSEDEGEQSVTASVPLVESTMATYREGRGCQLEEWAG